MGNKTKITAYDVYKERMYNLLMKFNEEAAQNVPELLEKHKGKEHELYLKMCRKYAVKAEDEFVESSDSEESQSEPSVNSNSGSDDSDSSADEKKEEKLPAQKKSLRASKADIKRPSVKRRTSVCM